MRELRLNDKWFIREFTDELSQNEIDWHKDRRNRYVSVLQCDPGWAFQFDNNIPTPLSVGEELFIPAEYWHRLIKGRGKLVVEITEE